MFDIGFSELILIAIVGLIVIGPERLPETIRVTMRWVRNIRNGFEQAKRDVEQELGVDDIKRDLHNEEVLKALNSVKSDLQKAQRSISEIPYDAQTLGNSTVPSETPAATEAPTLDNTTKTSPPSSTTP